MSEHNTLIADCPRKGCKNSTFDILSDTMIGQYQNMNGSFIEFEVFGVCRGCEFSTIWSLTAPNDVYGLVPSSPSVISENINKVFSIGHYISSKDKASTPPPEYLPKEIDAIFKEASSCQSINCFNAAAAMFRLCLDMATKGLLPEKDNIDTKVFKNISYSLGKRLTWLFENEKLPQYLHDLATCIKDDGNSGAHDGSITTNEAEDISDFTRLLLDGLYTQPEKIKLVKERQDKRREQKK